MRIIIICTMALLVGGCANWDWRSTGRVWAESICRSSNKQPYPQSGAGKDNCDMQKTIKQYQK